MRKYRNEMDYDPQAEAFGDNDDFVLTLKEAEDEMASYDEWSRALDTHKTLDEGSFELSDTSLAFKEERNFTNRVLSRDHISDKDLLHAVSLDYFSIVEEAFARGKNFEGNKHAQEKALAEPLLFSATSLNMRQFLLKLGVNPNSRDTDGDTLAHNVASTLFLKKSMARRYDLASLNMLINAKADMNARNAAGKTVLYSLLENFESLPRDVKDMAKRMVEAGADVNMPDNNGVTLYQKAVKSGNKCLTRFVHSLRETSDSSKQVVSTQNKTMQKIVGLQKEYS